MLHSNDVMFMKQYVNKCSISLLDHRLYDAVSVITALYAHGFALSGRNDREYQLHHDPTVCIIRCMLNRFMLHVESD
jgi:hypothetical protein